MEGVKSSSPILACRHTGEEASGAAGAA